MFSVVIPLFNKEISVKSTIESVLNQTLNEFEIVIVNDGSTDNSVQEVEQFNDDRIRLIHQENQGVSSARNRGIKEAKYKWIAFLDGDDMWENNHLSEIKRMMEEFPDAKVFSTSFKLSTGREIVGDRSKQDRYKIGSFFKDFLEFRGLVITISVVLHKSCIDKVGGFDKAIALGEDIDLWARLSKEYDIYKSNTITAIYRKDAENRSDSRKYNMKKSFLSKIDFGSMTTIEEKRFYRFWIIHKAKTFIVQKDYKNLWFLMRKYGLRLSMV